MPCNVNATILLTVWSIAAALNVLRFWATRAQLKKFLLGVYFIVFFCQKNTYFWVLMTVSFSFSLILSFLMILEFCNCCLESFSPSTRSPVICSSFSCIRSWVWSFISLEVVNINTQWGQHKYTNISVFMVSFMGIFSVWRHTLVGGTIPFPPCAGLCFMCIFFFG